MGCHTLLQAILSTQGSKPRSPGFFTTDSLPLSHQESIWTTVWSKRTYLCVNPSETVAILRLLATLRPGLLTFNSRLNGTVLSGRRISKKFTQGEKGALQN